MTDPLRIAVAGLGYWGPNIVRNLHELDEAEVVGVCDLDELRLASLLRRYPGIRGATRFEDILSSREVEAVVIATPVTTHFDLALAAINAGKHVFVEKPLAASTEQGEALVRAASAAGVTIMPGHTFLYSPPVVAIHDLIVSGEIGDLLFVSASRVNLGLHQSDVSVVWDLAPHDFSILRYWLGESPTHIRATARACIVKTIPDIAFIDLAYASEMIAHVELSWLAPSKLRRTTIVGTRKMIVYDDTSNEPVRVFDSGVDLPSPETFGEYRMTYRTGDIVSPRIDAAEPLRAELADFCAAVRTGKTPRSSMAVGLDVLRMIEAVDRSLKADGARVELESSFAVDTLVAS